MGDSEQHTTPALLPKTRKFPEIFQVSSTKSTVSEMPLGDKCMNTDDDFVPSMKRTTSVVLEAKTPDVQPLFKVPIRPPKRGPPTADKLAIEIVINLIFRENMTPKSKKVTTMFTQKSLSLGVLPFVVLLQTSFSEPFRSPYKPRGRWRTRERTRWPTTTD